MIPKVKTFQITYYFKGKRVYRTYIETINREFALYFATHRFIPEISNYDKVTAGLRKGNRK